MNVLSLFDGMSCGQIALNRAGFNVENYFASEIDKHAIAVTQKNYPDTIQLGDVTKISGHDFVAIDLLLGGSPCQGFSFAGLQLAFDDPRSRLFFEYVRILKEIREYNPHVKFLLENVRMKKEHEAVITEILQCEPVRINSALVSAQNRRRLYWTNIAGNIPQPEDRGILLKHILQENVVGYDLTSTTLKRIMNRYKPPPGNGTFGVVNQRKGFLYSDKSNCLDTRYGTGQVDNVGARTFIAVGGAIRGRGKKGNIEQGIELNGTEKSNSLTTVEKDNIVSISERIGGVSITPQGIRPYKDDYKKSSLSEFGTIRHTKGKSGCLVTAHVPLITDSMNLNTCKFRRLTEMECERLQTVPDKYTEGVSSTQRYRMLGNGWNIDTIVHLLTYHEDYVADMWS